MVFMYTATNPDLVDGLRYTLEVMEEHSHMGLDDEYAATLSRILKRRIAEAEQIQSHPPRPVRLHALSRVSA
jgi:hypothetical protein